jgi:hypothetical protein
MSCRPRPQVWNGSSVDGGRFTHKDGSAVVGTKEDCDKYVMDNYGENSFSGGSVTWGYGGTQKRDCYRGCPDDACKGSDDAGAQILKCNPRPYLTAVDIYYETLTDATKTCRDKSEAYRKAVDESGGDPTFLGFTADCPNPYACSVEGDVQTDKYLSENGVLVTGSDGKLKPVDVPPQNSTSSNSFACINGGWVPSFPKLPEASKIFDSFGSAGEPVTRLTMTVDEIAQIPLEKDFGGDVESSLAQMLTAHPTLADIEPKYLTDISAKLPNFVWCCVPTQAEYDLLSDTDKCLLFSNYFDLYDQPEIISRWRTVAPTITITKESRPAVAPTYVGDPNTARREQCEGAGGKYINPTGKCFGSCENTPPPPPSDGIEDTPEYVPPEDDGSGADLSSVIMVAGVVAVVGIVGYQIFKMVSPTGRAMSMASGGAPMGGFRLVPA